MHYGNEWRDTSIVFCIKAQGNMEQLMKIFHCHVASYHTQVTIQPSTKVQLCLNTPFHVISYQAISIHFYRKASLSLGLLRQRLQLSSCPGAVWTPLGIRVLLSRAVGGLLWPVFPLEGW